MANAEGQVTLHGRFRAGALVRLVKVESDLAQRSEGGELIAEAVVDADNRVRFSDGVEVGARYFVVGLIDGAPVEVRARGNDLDAPEDSVLSQPPVQPERQKLADGSFQDELVAVGAPRQAEDPQPPEKKAAPKRASGKSTTAKSAARGSARKG